MAEKLVTDPGLIAQLEKPPTLVDVPGIGVVDFGDMKDEEIEAAIKQHLPSWQADANNAGTGKPVTDPALIAQLEAGEQPGSASGIAKSAASGLVTGAAGLAGTPGDIKAWQDYGLKKGMDYFGVSPETQEMVSKVASHLPVAPFLPAGMPTTSQILEPTKKAAEAVGVPLHEPQGNVERYVNRAAEFIPGAVTAPFGGEAATAVNFAKNALRLGAAGLTSTAAGDVAHAGMQNNYLSPETREKISPYVEGAAQVAGGMLGPGMIGKLVSPNAARISPTMQQHAAVLKSEGITPTAGDILADRGLRSTESELRPDIQKQQLEDFTRAAGRRIGLDEPNLTIGTGGNLPARRNEIGKQWDAVLGRNDFQEDPGLYQDLKNTHDYYHRVPGLYDDAVTKALDGSIIRINHVLRTNSGSMSAADYQQLRSQLRDAAMSGEDSVKSGALHDITNALDNAFERHLQRTGSPDAAAMPELRKEYRALLTVEKARVKQGEKAAQGTVTPPALQSAAKSIYGNMAYENGQTPFTDLAEAGSALLTPRPDSGTAGRMGVEQRVQNIARGLGGLVGGAVGSHMGGTEPGVFGLLAGEAAAAPFISGPIRAAIKFGTTNPASQWRASNTFMPPMSSQNQAMVRALAGYQAAQPYIAAPPTAPRRPAVNVGARPGYYGR